jgi:hypothetical protein
LAFSRLDRACGRLRLGGSRRSACVLGRTLCNRGPRGHSHVDCAARPVAANTLQTPDATPDTQRRGLRHHDRPAVSTPAMAGHRARRGSRRNDSVGRKERQRDDHSRSRIRPRGGPSTLPRLPSTVARRRNSRPRPDPRISVARLTHGARAGHPITPADRPPVFPTTTAKSRERANFSVSQDRPNVREDVRSRAEQHPRRAVSVRAPADE